MPQAIVGVALIALGEYAGTAVLVQIGTVLLLSRISKMFSGKPARFHTETTQTVTFDGSISPRMIIYGQARVSGVSVFA